MINAKSISFSQFLMAGFTHTDGVLLVEVEDGLVSIRGMTAVAADTLSGIFIHNLPACKEKMPMPVLGFTVSSEVLIFHYVAALGDLLMAFQAMSVTDRLGQGSWLDGCTCVPLKSIFCPQQFSLQPAKQTLPGVTVDAACALEGVMGCQVDRL